MVNNMSPENRDLPSTDSSRNPALIVASQRNFQYFWIAQFLIQVVCGAMRFAFLWHAPQLGEITWTVPLLGFATSIPGLIVVLPVGAIADRTNHKTYSLVLSVVATGLLLLTGILLVQDSLDIYSACILALLLGTIQAGSRPVFQAMVPKLVESRLLATGVALQNVGSMGSQVIGAIIAGVLISLIGTGSAFVLWGVLAFIAFISFYLMSYPSRNPTNESYARPTIFSGISDGIRLCFSSTPIRSLIFGGFLIGIGGGAWTTLLPEIGRDQIGFGPGYTSLLAALVSVGMISSTLFIATRRLFNNKTVYFLISVNCFGPGLIFLGFTQEPIWAFTYMFISGLYAGVFLTTQRTLLQENAPSDFVARIMSLNVFVNAGTVPISTGIIWILRHMFSSGETLAIFGLAVTLLSLLLTLSRKSTWDRHFDA